MSPLLFKLRAAILNARRHTGDETLSIQAHKGECQVICVKYLDNGGVCVAAASPWGDTEAIIAHLGTLRNAHGVSFSDLAENVEAVYQAAIYHASH